MLHWAFFYIFGVVWKWQLGCEITTGGVARLLAATLAATSERQSPGLHPTVWQCSVKAFFWRHTGWSGFAQASRQTSSSSAEFMWRLEVLQEQPNPNLFSPFPFHFHNNCGMSPSLTTSSQLWLCCICGWVRLDYMVTVEGAKKIPGSARTTNWQNKYK